MSTLKEQLRADLGENIKSGKELEKTTLRNVLGAIQSAEKSGKVEQNFGDEEVLSIIAKEVKKRRETAAEYRELAERGAVTAERREHLVQQAVREVAEAEVLTKYLPTQLEAAELEQIIAKAIADTGAASVKDMGRVMKQVTGEVQGRADGKTISTLVRAKLA